MEPGTAAGISGVPSHGSWSRLGGRVDGGMEVREVRACWPCPSSPPFCSSWNRSRPWRSSAATAVPPTLAGAVRRRPDPAAIRQIHSSPAGAHNLAITVPSRCRRLPVLTASLTCIQGSFDIGLCFPFLGLGNDVPGSTRGARNVWYGRVFVRPGKLLSAFLALD